MVVVLSVVHGGSGSSSRPLDPSAQDFVPSSSSPPAAPIHSSSSFACPSSSSADKYRDGGDEDGARLGDVALHRHHAMPLPATWTPPSSSPDQSCHFEQSDFVPSAAMPILALPDHPHPLHHHSSSDYSQQQQHQLQIISMTAGPEHYHAQLSAVAGATNNFLNFMPALVPPPGAPPIQPPAVFLQSSMMSEQWEGTAASFNPLHGTGTAVPPAAQLAEQGQYFCRYPSPLIAQAPLLQPAIQSPTTITHHQQYRHHHLQQRSLVNFAGATSAQAHHIVSSSAAFTAIRAKRGGGSSEARERMSRSLQLVGVPTGIDEGELLRELSMWGDVRALHSEKKAEGLVTVHFFDIRCAKSALTDIQHQHLLQQQRVQKQLLQRSLQRNNVKEEGVTPQSACEVSDMEALGEASGADTAVWGLETAAEHAVELYDDAERGAGKDGKGIVGGRAIWAHYTIPVDLQIEDSVNQGTLVVFNLEIGTQADEVRAIFEKYGPVKEVREAPLRRQHKFVEFFDVRDAAAALHALDGTEMHGKKLKLEFSRPVGYGSRKISNTPPARTNVTSLSSSHRRQHFDYSRSSSLHVGYPSYLPNEGMASNSSSTIAAGVSSEALSMSAHSFYWPCSPWPAAASAASTTTCGSYGTASLFPPPVLPQVPGASPQIAYGAASLQAVEREIAGIEVDEAPVLSAQPIPVVEHQSTISPRSVGTSLPRHTLHEPNVLSTVACSYSSRWSTSNRVQHTSDGYSHSLGVESALRRSDVRRNVSRANRGGNNSSWRSAATTSSAMARDVGSDRGLSLSSMRIKASPSAACQDQYKFDEMEALAAAGASSSAASSIGFCNIRTTLMIRNIPNKYTQQMLISMLDDHCAECNSQLMARDDADEPLSAFDFVYLPIDFKNRCNLGYAFVNLTSPQATVRLHKAFHGRQWDEFNSRKICEVTYARLQGREALEEHFKNSRFACDTDEYLPVVFSPPRGGVRLVALPGTAEESGSSLLVVAGGERSNKKSSDGEEEGSMVAVESAALPMMLHHGGSSISKDSQIVPRNVNVPPDASNTVVDRSSSNKATSPVGIALGRRLMHHHHHHGSYRYAGILPHQPR